MREDTRRISSEATKVPQESVPALSNIQASKRYPLRLFEIEYPTGFEPASLATSRASDCASNSRLSIQLSPPASTS